MGKSLHNFKEELSRNGVFLCFSGPISHDLMVEMGDILKFKMKLQKENLSTILKVFSLLIEQTQNIIYYSAETIPNPDQNENGTLHFGIISVGYENDRYFVLGGNKIMNTDIDIIRARLTKLQKMDKDQIKSYYREQRKQTSHEKSRGAGLGFIEVARKSSKPIEFNIKKIDHEYSFFSLKTTI